MRKILLKMKSVLLGTLVVVLLSACGNTTAQYLESPAEEPVLESQEPEAASHPKDTQTSEVEHSIYVYVCGQVKVPGVYSLPEGSRVYDAFVAAGELTEEAAADYWNQARLLVDGEMIYVPTIEEAKERKSGDLTIEPLGLETDDGKVNINTASKEELMTVPGIGEAKAAAIIVYREQNGPFASLEELMQVEGIKDGVFSKMKDYIKIN